MSINDWTSTAFVIFIILYFIAIPFILSKVSQYTPFKIKSFGFLQLNGIQLIKLSNDLQGLSIGCLNFRFVFNYGINVIIDIHNVEIKCSKSSKPLFQDNIISTETFGFNSFTGQTHRRASSFIKKQAKSLSAPHHLFLPKTVKKYLFLLKSVFLRYILSRISIHITNFKIIYEKSTITHESLVVSKIIEIQDNDDSEDQDISSQTFIIDINIFKTLVLSNRTEIMKCDATHIRLMHGKSIMFGKVLDPEIQIQVIGLIITPSIEIPSQNNIKDNNEENLYPLLAQIFTLKPSIQLILEKSSILVDRKLFYFESGLFKISSEMRDTVKGKLLSSISVEATLENSTINVVGISLTEHILGVPLLVIEGLWTLPIGVDYGVDLPKALGSFECDIQIDNLVFHCSPETNFFGSDSRSNYSPSPYSRALSSIVILIHPTIKIRCRSLSFEVFIGAFKTNLILDSFDLSISKTGYYVAVGKLENLTFQVSDTAHVDKLIHIKSIEINAGYLDRSKIAFRFNNCALDFALMSTSQIDYFALCLEIQNIPESDTKRKDSQPAILSEYRLDFEICHLNLTILSEDGSVGYTINTESSALSLDLHCGIVKNSLSINQINITSINNYLNYTESNTDGDRLVNLTDVLFEQSQCSSKDALFSVTAKELSITYNVRLVYTFIHTAAYMLKLGNLLINPYGAIKSSVLPTQLNHVPIQIQSINIDMNLPNKAFIGILLTLVNVELISNGSFILNTAHIEMNTKINAVNIGIAQIENLIVTHLSKAVHEFHVKVDMMSIHYPHNFVFANLIENFVNSIKVIQYLIGNVLGVGKTTSEIYEKKRIKADSAPIIKVEMKNFEISVDDDPFDSQLLMNYEAGLKEQAFRLNRQDAFERKADDIRSKRATQTHDINNVEGMNDILEELHSAYYLLMSHNAACWQTIQDNMKHSDGGSKICMKAVFSDLKLQLSTAEILADTVEETLHFLDKTTSPDIEYDDLICRNFDLSFNELKIQLKDTKLPLLNISASLKDDRQAFSTSGLIVIAEQKGADESYRSISIPLTPISLPDIKIRRMVNPTKIYSNSKTHIYSGSDVKVNWGISIEPFMADFARMIDTFTLSNPDPSETIGWWDKLRLLIHGQNRVFFHEAGICIRLSGSYSPYFDPRYHFGTEGLEFQFRRNVEFGFGIPDKDRKNNVQSITINADQLLLASPLNSEEGGKEEIVACLTGKIKSIVNITFLNELGTITRGHTDIVLKDPSFVDMDDYDAFSGFRTKEMLIDINITSPFLSSNMVNEGDSQNYINLTPQILNVFSSMIPQYQNPLSSIPIRSGKLFNKIESNPKLSRYFKQVHLKIDIEPLLAGLTYYMDHSSGVGLRIKAEHMFLDMMFEQKLFNKKRDELAQVQRVATKWSLESSEINFTDMEARSVTIDNDMEVEPKLNDFKSWIMQCDVGRIKKVGNFSMNPFAWTPKFIYFKRTDNLNVNANGSGYNNTIELVELNELQGRLNELIESIRELMETQHKLEERMKLSFTETYIQQSQLIIAKLEMLHNKKIVIERYMDQSLKGGRKRKTSNNNETLFTGRSTFDHNYIIYGIKLLWSKDVRNTIVRLLSLQSLGSTIQYFLTNNSNKLVKDLIRTMKEKSELSDSTDEPDKIEVVPLVQSKSRGPYALNEQGVNELLAKLIDDISHFFVPNETEEVLLDNTSLIDKVYENKNRSNLQTRAGDKIYIPSQDPESLDYISASNSFNSSYMIELVYPQISMESAIDDRPEFMQSLLVTSENMVLMSIEILDCAEENVDDAESLEYEEHIFKNRTILTVKESQFFVSSKIDVESSKTNQVEIQSTWPVWIPLECFIDPSSETMQLKQIVERSSISVHKEQFNTLYHGNREVEDKTTTFHIAFPNIQISVDSPQYNILHNIITDLIVYKDPNSCIRNERKAKMILALQQSEDIINVVTWVISLQEKIKKTQLLIIRSQRLPSQIVSKELIELYACQRKYNEELFVIMSSIRELQNMNLRKNSLEIEWKITLVVDKLIWFMVNAETNEPFAKWLLEGMSYQWVQKADSANSNTLEIQKFCVQNLIKSSPYEELINAYTPGMKVIDFERQKMLRVYWREMPAVAGIQVVDHFEINFFPLNLQLSYESAKQLMHYIFPAKEKLMIEDYDSTQSTVSSFRGLQGMSDSSDRLDLIQNYATKSKMPSLVMKDQKKVLFDQLREMQNRSIQNKSFIYIKVPGTEHCLSYRGSKEKNLEDLNGFVFKMPTLEYRNKTWTFFDFLQQAKRDAIRAILIANTASLVKEKLFSRTKAPLEEVKKQSVSQPLVPLVPLVARTSNNSIQPSEETTVDGNETNENSIKEQDTLSYVSKGGKIEKLKRLFNKK